MGLSDGWTDGRMVAGEQFRREEGVISFLSREAFLFIHSFVN